MGQNLKAAGVAGLREKACDTCSCAGGDAGRVHVGVQRWLLQHLCLYTAAVRHVLPAQGPTASTCLQLKPVAGMKYPFVSRLNDLFQAFQPALTYVLLSMPTILLVCCALVFLCASSPPPVPCPLFAAAFCH